jgi:D-alanyl-D-alanine carboxypeptidase (penicillin-binding protein 5/6)
VLAAGAAALGATAGAASAAAPPVLAPTAEAAVLYDADTGQVLYARQAERRLMPASTTKILTALVVLQHVHDLGRRVRITAAEAYVGGSSAPMQPGERLTVRDLLYGLLLVSGNDAAVALADATAGSVPRFVAMMNREARALGATRTHFVNPDGLPDPRHLTTALDLARIAAAAVRQPELVRILGTQVLPDYPMPSGKPVPMVNQDRLLWTYPGIVGGKIGYTDQAGNTMVAIARRHGMTLVAVVLHDLPWTYFGDEAQLLDYGFAHFRRTVLVRAGAEVATRPVAGVPGRRAQVAAGRTVVWDVPQGGRVATALHLVAPARLPPGRRRGTAVGRLAVYAGGRLAARVPAVLARSTPVPPPPPLGRRWGGALGLAAAAAVAWAWSRRRRARPRRRYRLRRDSVWLRMAGGAR